MISNGAEPKFGSLNILKETPAPSDDQCAIINESVSGDYLFRANLCQRQVLADGSHWCIWSTLDVSRVGPANVEMTFAGDRDVGKAQLGLLLAACLAVPEAMPASPRCPLIITLHLNGEGDGAMREAMDLVACMRPLTVSTTITRHTDPNPCLVARIVPARPLGILNVRVP